MYNFFKEYLKIRKLFILDISNKYKKQYKINIHDWSSNPYYVLKYKFIYELASIISFVIFKTKITPNLITLVNLFLALLAAFIFLFNYIQFKIFGILIFFGKQVLDNIDGFIARKKKLFSVYGKKLDQFCGQVYYYSIIISFIAHNFHLSKNNIIIFIGAIIILLDLINIFFKKNIKSFKNKTMNNYFNNKLDYFKFLNFDGRTLKTDFLLFIIIAELSFNFFIISELLIYIFLISKLLRNIYRAIFNEYGRNK